MVGGLFDHLKTHRRRRKLRKQLDRLEFSHPAPDWRPFRKIAEFFVNRRLSELDEQAFLYRLASAAPADAVFLEIGSWIGHSSCILASALRGPKGRVYAIDAFEGTSESETEKDFFRSWLGRKGEALPQRLLFDRHLARFGVAGRVTPVPAYSDKARRLLDLPEESVDLLFIDGGHTLEVVRSDIALYLPLVKRGGIVAFHDFQSAFDVPTAVWESVRDGAFSDIVGIHGTLIAFKKA